MKAIKCLVLLFFIISFNSVSYSQEFSAGISSGLNFSDIHGNSNEGKWKFKPGPVQSMFFDYSFNNFLGIHTGLSYSSLYYEHVTYSNGFPMYDFSSNRYPPVDIYFPHQETMDFSFLTIPVQIKLLIPSKPQVTFSAGIFYSFLQDFSINNYYNSADPVESDFGYIYSAGLSYPLNKSITGSFNLNYLTGRKEFLEYSSYRHGSFDFSLGLAYRKSFKRDNLHNPQSDHDSTFDRIYVTYRQGLNISWNSGNYFNEKYSSNTGISIGLAVNFRWSEKTSFQTGLSFERVGYAFSDSSKSFYVYVPGVGRTYDVDTEMNIDYIVIPALINFYAGKTNQFFFNTGPYLGVKLNAFCNGTAVHEVKGGASYQLIETNVNDDVEGLIKGNDFGWAFGAGLTIPLFNKLLIDCGLQYRAGLIDIYDKEFLPENSLKKVEETMIQNGAVTFQIGIRLPSR